jgi:hypothetical protein
MEYVTSSTMRARNYGGLPDRYPSTQANPVASSNKITRETISVSRQAPPRWQHPKLNYTPWSTSYAVSRPKMAKSKTKKVRHG